MPRILAITSQVLGVGNTSTVINLSAWIALLGKKVLIIDTDPLAGATLSLGLGNKELIDLKQVLEENLPLEAGITNTSIKDLDIVPMKELDEDEKKQFFSIFEEDISLFRDSVDFLEQEYDFIIIDLPYIEHSLTNAVLSASDSVIVLMKSEPLFLDSVSELIETVVNVKESMNKWLELEGFLISMYDNDEVFSRQIAVQAKEKFKDLMFKTIIPKNKIISDANKLNTPVALYDMKSFGSETYLRLAKEVLR